MGKCEMEPEWRSRIYSEPRCDGVCMPWSGLEHQFLDLLKISGFGF